jgi:soluble lytic murein transglycosylase-like protein
MQTASTLPGLTGRSARRAIGPTLVLVAGLALGTHPALAAGGALTSAAGALPLTAALPPASQPTSGPEIEVPKPLEETDAARYRQIFRLQSKGDWKGADEIIGSLTDLRLMGHVLAQRYLAPTYKTRYAELSEWLAKYGDHPDAPAIYTLALKKKPAGAAAPAEPNVSSFRGGTPDGANRAPAPAEWAQGLEAWRKGNSKLAASLFEKAAKESNGNPWVQSAAAYWAARAHIRNREPQKVSEWLRLAAGEPRTFYGQLARRALGVDTAFAWADPVLTPDGADALMATRAGQRALALIQIGQRQRASDEFHLLRPQAGPELTQGMLAIANQIGMPSLTLGLGASLEDKSGFRLDNALFPTPSWTPKGGFKVNRALLFALARTESGFNPEAKSPVGALGLMQLMPPTVKYTGARLAEVLGTSKPDWRDPETNMALGQEYVQYLLEDSNVNGDLLLMAAAYNAGPGNLAKWRDKFAYDNDPLLFLESMPSRETHDFAQRVLASMWIYQQRLGQDSPTLDALAAGAWPQYRPQDDEAVAAADNASN